MKRYVLAVDQSTQGTKGLIFDDQGLLIARADRPHRQLVSEQGWVSHDTEEILRNVLGVCRNVIEKAQIDPQALCAMGISNQRETTVAWNKKTGQSICPAIVWQCARAAEICARHESMAEDVQQKTGIRLSPYFPAAKMSWIMEHVPEARTLASENLLAFGTVDSWLLYALTKECVHKTDYSNASRTQLFDIRTLHWDEDICTEFGIPVSALPEVCMSDTIFGTTDLDGYLKTPIPICGVLGDSHGALFGQDCRRAGQIKATYGTGSSVMMNVGETPRFSAHGLATSIAWGLNGKIAYVLEGNLNYTGAVISWLKQDVGLLASDAEATELARAANPNDKAYFVPAFSGLGAPYWDSEAAGLLTGVTRTTGKNEIAKACLESIAYQITDLICLMRQDAGVPVERLRVDGGPTASDYLMQFQSDMSQVIVQIPQIKELSAMGVAYVAGISAGVYEPDLVFAHIVRTEYLPQMEQGRRMQLYAGWQQAVARTLMKPQKSLV